MNDISLLWVSVKLFLVANNLMALAITVAVSSRVVQVAALPNCRGGSSLVAKLPDLFPPPLGEVDDSGMVKRKAALCYRLEKVIRYHMPFLAIRVSN